MWAKRIVVAAGLFLGAGVGAVRPAAACGMELIFREVSPAQADRLLAAAADAAAAGGAAKAWRLASRVAASGRTRPAQRAEALAIMGLVDWQRGRQAAALRSFRRARAADGQGGTLDRVLARLRPAELPAVRAALAG